jgi:hypothetical protein
VKVLGIDKELFFKNKNRREIFITTPNFTIENAKKIMLDFVINNPSKETQKKNEIIKELENLCNNNVLIEQAKAKQAEANANAKQAEADIQIAKEKTKQAEIESNRQIEIAKQKTRQMELKFENKKEKKNEKVPEVVEEKIVEEKSDCVVFLEEHTIEANTHIHCSELYKRYKIWYKNKYPNDEIPSNKLFVADLRKYHEVCKVYVNKSQIGIKNLALK